MRPSLRLVLSAVLFSTLAACAAKHAAPSHAQPTHDSSHEASGPHPHGMPHRFEDAEAWAQRFESPERDSWQKPDEVIAALKIPHGGKLADIGAATGYFPVRIARARPDVAVYGVDIEPDMVRYLGDRAAREKLWNIQPVLGEPSDPKLPEAVDVVLLVNTYHHIESRPAYFARLASMLRSGARVAVVDFTLDSEMGPPKSHKLSPDQVTAELREAGYRLVETHDFLPHQYLLVFERAQ